jgi:hypothetical protein
MTPCFVLLTTVTLHKACNIKYTNLSVKSCIDAVNVLCITPLYGSLANLR